MTKNIIQIQIHISCSRHVLPRSPPESWAYGDSGWCNVFGFQVAFIRFRVHLCIVIVHSFPRVSTASCTACAVSLKHLSPVVSLLRRTCGRSLFVHSYFSTPQVPCTQTWNFSRTGRKASSKTCIQGVLGKRREHSGRVFMTPRSSNWQVSVIYVTRFHHFKNVTQQHLTAILFQSGHRLKKVKSAVEGLSFRWAGGAVPPVRAF